MLRLFPIRKSFLALLSTLFLISALLFVNLPAFAESVSPLGEQDHFYLDKIQLVAQQIDLLKKRLTQADQELNYLQHQQEKGFTSFADDQTNKFLLYKTGLHLASAKSNQDSINIELADSQQALSWLEKNIQEIENQLNALNIFGLKLIHGDAAQIQGLRSELKYQENLRHLEKQRSGYLFSLQKTESLVLQLYGEQYAQVNAFLKSRKLLHIKEQQVKSELEFQEQQNYWLQRLDDLYGEMKNSEAKSSKNQYSRLESEIFYANENINLVYLKTLIARYKDQLRQIRLSIARTNSISLLNSLSDQTQTLGKQISRVDKLIDHRVEIIKKRQTIYNHEKQSKNSHLKPEASSGAVTQQVLPSTAAEPVGQFAELEGLYEDLRTDVAHFSKRLADFNQTLDKSVQHELAARQGLPGFSSHAWLDLGKEVLLVPTLSFQLIKGFAFSLVRALERMALAQWLLFGLLEALFVLAFSYTRKNLLRLLEQASALDVAVINTRQLLGSLLFRNLRLIAIIANAWLLFYFWAIPRGQFDWLIDLALVWLLFRLVLTIARTGLVETVHDVKGRDVQLYLHLKTLFIFGTVITSLTVFIHQLPLIYEIKDLFDRLFLLMLLVVSLLILRSWRVVPQLILQYVDPRRTYLRRIIYFLGVFIPSLLFINSLIGLFGFVNLVGMISWYEGVFTLVLVTYFIVRAFLSDLMEFLSHLMIRHVNNGWLWTEAFLKPLHKVLHLLLFLGAWVLLFLLYGWNQQSPVVERLNKLLLYPIIDVLNTTITPISILELIVASSLFYWAARWTREFVYRLLLSKTSDLGIRNSMAILSQYGVVIIGVLICLRLLGIDLHALFLVASGLLIAISFGLRDLVNNFACGLILLFERPIRVGDIVCVNDQEGKVTHIGSRAVTVRTWDHMEIIVPNTEIFNKSFINWTVQDDIVRTVISIKIDRKDSPYEVQKLIHSVLKENKDVLFDPEPEVFLKDMVDNHSEFEVRYYINVRKVHSRVGVRSDVLFSLWQAFDKHGIKIPNLQREIFIKNQLPLLPAPEG